MARRVDLKIAPQFVTVAELRQVWRLADEAGFDGCWDFDHFNSIGRATDGPVLEGWALLGAMAEATRRVRIGCMVTGITYRHPAVLAKMAATIDHLSAGRLDVGVGAAWAANEHETLGIPFPPNGPRIAALGEACVVMKKLWTEPRSSFGGKHFTLRDAVAEPKPVQRPHPPLWIGGEGEKLLLRVVARHADVWNHSSSDPAKSARLSRILDGHCAAVGRDPTAVTRSVQLFYHGRPGQPAGERDVHEVTDEFLRLADGLVAAGFPYLIAVVTNVADAEHVAALLPRLRELG